MRFKAWVHNLMLKKKIGYIFMFFLYLVSLFLGIGPFLTLNNSSDGTHIVLNGYNFLVNNEAGNFAWLGWIGFIYVIIVIVLSLIVILIPDVTATESMYWIIIGLGILVFISFGVLSNYYMFTFQFGEKTSNISTNVGVCCWLYDIFLWVSFIPFIVFKYFQSGDNGSYPLDATYLKEKDIKK